VNRREMLKGAAAASLAALSASCTSNASSNNPISGAQPKRPTPSGINVLFFGLWAFWYRQANPVNGTEGILAFSPEVKPDPSTKDPGHSYTAKFKNGHLEATLEGSVPYWISTDGSSQQTGKGLWDAARNHNAGIFLSTDQGNLIVNPLSPDEMRRNHATTIWLPYPDDIVPVATIDMRKYPLFATTGNDLGNADKKDRWPMVEAFVYGNSSSLALNDDVSTTTGKANLHIIVQPSQPIQHDGGYHAGEAWKKLLKLVPKKDNTMLDITFASNLPDDMGVCSDLVQGVDGNDEIPPLCTRGGSPAPTASTSSQNGRVNPSNCAAGCGLEIGP
jgi:hypothetical protein